MTSARGPIKHCIDARDIQLGDEMLQLEPARLMKVMKLDGKIQKRLRDGK